MVWSPSCWTTSTSATAPRCDLGGVSKLYAEGLQGDVHVWLPKGLTMGSIFWNDELPMLRKLQKEERITSLWFHVRDEKSGDWSGNLTFDQLKIVDVYLMDARGVNKGAASLLNETKPSLKGTLEPKLPNEPWHSDPDRNATSGLSQCAGAAASKPEPGQVPCQRHHEPVSGLTAVTLRPLHGDDAFTLALMLDDEATRRLARLPFGGSLRDVQSFIDRRLKQLGQSWVVLEDGEPAGYASLAPQPALPEVELALRAGGTATWSRSGRIAVRATEG